MSDLLPCPFCGGGASRQEIEAVDGEANAGGSFIECDRCGACSAVHFDRKENLVSSWNDRCGAGILLKDANDLDAVVRELRIEDSHVTPAEAVRELKTTNALLEQTIQNSAEIVRGAEARAEAAEDWSARERETQEALQKIGEEFGVYGGEPRTSGIKRVLTEQRSYISALRSELALSKKYLLPFGRCAAVFGPDWADDDEIAVEPLDDAGNGNGALLFKLRVYEFRAAAEFLVEPAKIECPYCGAATNIRMLHDGGGFTKPDYVCEDCFGGCGEPYGFDDLLPVGKSPEAPS